METETNLRMLIKQVETENANLKRKVADTEGKITALQFECAAEGSRVERLFRFVVWLKTRPEFNAKKATELANDVKEGRYVPGD